MAVSMSLTSIITESCTHKLFAEYMKSILHEYKKKRGGNQTFPHGALSFFAYSFF